MKRTHNRLGLWGITLGFVVLPILANAAIGDVESTVRRLLVDDTDFGICMVRLYDVPQGVDCGNHGWFTASCSGDFNSSNLGWKKFETAQIAYATNAPVRVFVDDARKHNNRCFITRIILNEN